MSPGPVALVGQLGKRSVRVERRVLGASTASCNFWGVGEQGVPGGFSGQCPCSSAVYTGFWAKGQAVCNPVCGSAKTHLQEREKAMHSKGGRGLPGGPCSFSQGHTPPTPAATGSEGLWVGEATPSLCIPSPPLSFSLSGHKMSPWALLDGGCPLLKFLNASRM